uniref:Uncharacterized protein n=1 Tax=Plectus sambesii TaxID=2011161 RepID=A0A914USA8_9BILA
MDEKNNNVNRTHQLITAIPSDSSAPNTLRRPRAGVKINEDEIMEHLCVCNRPMAHIVCRKCGAEFDGRVFMQCEAHPNKIPLMDYQECVNRGCRSQMLSEMASQRK